MRDIPQPTPEDEKNNQELRAAISTYVQRILSEHSYLSYLETEKASRAEARALELAETKLAEFLKNNPGSSPNLEDLVLLSTHAAMKEQMPWMYHEDLPGVTTEDLGESEIDREQARDQMEAIIKENYKDKPAEFRDAILKSFREALQNTRSHFTVVRKGDDILAFCRFDYHKKTRSQQKYPGDDVDYIYMGSVNLNPKLRDSRMGEAMIQRMLNEVLDDVHVPLKADCQAYGPTGRNYIERYGFVATEAYDLYGVPSLKIEEGTGSWRTKKMTKAEIIKLDEQQAGENLRKVAAVNQAFSDSVNIIIEDLVVRRYEKDQTPEFGLLKQDYRLTRYFLHDDKTYCVYEKIHTKQELN